MALIATSKLLAVLEVVVPVGSSHELRLILAKLHIEPWEAIVQAALNTVWDGVSTAVGIHICLRERVLIAECQQGAETQCGVRVRIDKRIANHKLCAVVNPQQLLLQNHATHAICDCGCWGVLEVGDVLVTARLVGALEAVQCEVKRLVVLHNSLVERRQQYISAVAPVDRCNHQTVILACVATYDCGSHVATTAVRSKHLSVECILKITQLTLVKFQS